VVKGMAAAAETGAVAIAVVLQNSKQEFLLTRVEL